MTQIGIIGAGAWGTALAQCMANAGNDIMLWAREPDVVETINTSHTNRYLENVTLHDNITATASLSEAAGQDILLVVTPAQFVRSTLHALKGEIAEGKPIVICAKGIEIETGYLMSQVAEEEVPGASIAILTGPTFASEIAAGLPSAVTISAKDKDVAEEIQNMLATKSLRPYVVEDMIGVQIGGALKNVIAIGCGIIVGYGLGESARAALMTRGLAEMGRLASGMGAKKSTLTGMCGVGDLVLTCSSMQSRNYSFGVAFGKGQKANDIMGERQGKAVTEGVHTAEALITMAKNHAVDMPICNAVHQCLSGNKAIDEVIEDLLDRPLSTED